MPKPIAITLPIETIAARKHRVEQVKRIETPNAIMEAAQWYGRYERSWREAWS
jgi:hypothetical protein